MITIKKNLFTIIVFKNYKSFTKMTVKGLKEFIFENYYKQISFTEKDSWRVKNDLLLIATYLTKTM